MLNLPAEVLDQQPFLRNKANLIVVPAPGKVHGDTRGFLLRIAPVKEQNALTLESACEAKNTLQALSDYDIELKSWVNCV